MVTHRRLRLVYLLLLLLLLWLLLLLLLMLMVVLLVLVVLMMLLVGCVRVRLICPLYGVEGGERVLARQLEVVVDVLELL